MHHGGSYSSYSAVTDRMVVGAGPIEIVGLSFGACQVGFKARNFKP